jgi:hypothetical protein
MRLPRAEGEGRGRGARGAVAAGHGARRHHARTSHLRPTRRPAAPRALEAATPPPGREPPTSPSPCTRPRAHPLPTPAPPAEAGMWHVKRPQAPAASGGVLLWHVGGRPPRGTVWRQKVGWDFLAGVRKAGRRSRRSGVGVTKRVATRGPTPCVGPAGRRPPPPPPTGAAGAACRCGGWGGGGRAAPCPVLQVGGSRARPCTQLVGGRAGPAAGGSSLAAAGLGSHGSTRSRDPARARGQAVFLSRGGAAVNASQTRHRFFGSGAVYRPATSFTTVPSSATISFSMSTNRCSKISRPLTSSCAVNAAIAIIARRPLFSSLVSITFGGGG